MHKTLIAIALAFAVSTANAASIDFNTEIKTIDGKPFKNESGGDTAVTLGTIVEQALLARYDDDAKMNAEESGKVKQARYNLLMKVRGKASVELSASEVLMIRLLVGKGYDTYIVGRVFEMIDPGSKP